MNIVVFLPEKFITMFCFLQNYSFQFEQCLHEGSTSCNNYSAVQLIYRKIIKVKIPFNQDLKSPLSLASPDLKVGLIVLES